MRVTQLIFAVACLAASSKTAWAQMTWPEAPEKWSVPVKVAELSPIGYHYAGQPTLTGDGKTMYLFYFSATEGSGIYRSVFGDSGWSHPVRLSDAVTGGLTENPSVTPDGKRLLFRNYDRADNYGGWDLYYTDWDSAANNWGPVKNLGLGVNTDRDEWGCFSPDSEHLYFTWIGSQPRLSLWNSNTRSWEPSQWVEDFRFIGSWGRVAVPANKMKIYYDTFVSTKNSRDIYVNYFDSLSGSWSLPMVLNLNAAMDSLVEESTIFESRTAQAYPWISPDGRTMFFESNHDSSSDIWMSRMVVDENGNPISGMELPHEVPSQTIRVLEVYPNPFNGPVTIEYETETGGMLDVTIRNLLGQNVRSITESITHAGRQRTIWDACDEYGRSASSGVYLVLITNGSTWTVKKMVLLR